MEGFDILTKLLHYPQLSSNAHQFLQQIEHQDASHLKEDKRLALASSSPPVALVQDPQVDEAKEFINNLLTHFIDKTKKGKGVDIAKHLQIALLQNKHQSMNDIAATIVMFRKALSDNLRPDPLFGVSSTKAFIVTLTSIEELINAHYLGNTHLRKTILLIIRLAQKNNLECAFHFRALLRIIRSNSISLRLYYANTLRAFKD